MTNELVESPLGEKLSRHRSAAALSLRDVEKQTGISKANLSKLERGIHKNPTLDTLTALAGCYGVTVGALIGEATRCPAQPMALVGVAA